MPIAPPATQITLFQVPADADAAFLAGWERARGLLAPPASHGAAVLHRALRRDVAFRFVALAPVANPEVALEAVADAGAAAGGPGFAAHGGLYAIAADDGTPDVAGGVLRIGAFPAADDGDDRVAKAWWAARAVHAAQRGYLGARLHRRTGSAGFPFVEIARWSSPLMVARALGRPEFLAAAETLPASSDPALYQAIAH